MHITHYLEEYTTISFKLNMRTTRVFNHHLLLFLNDEYTLNSLPTVSYLREAISYSCYSVSLLPRAYYIRVCIDSVDILDNKKYLYLE